MDTKRRDALGKLGLTAAAVYSAPTLLRLRQVRANACSNASSAKAPGEPGNNSSNNPGQGCENANPNGKTRGNSSPDLPGFTN